MISVRKAIGVTFATLITLLLLVLASIAYLVATPGGTRLLLDTAREHAPGTLSFDSAEGTLIGPLDLFELSYQDDNLSIAIDRLHLDWLPSALGQSTAHITAFDASGIKVKLPPVEQEQSAPSGPIELPEVALPVAIRLDRLDLKEIHIEQGEAAPLIINSVHLAAEANGSDLQLKALEVQAAQGQLAVSGTVATRDRFPLDLTTRWTATIPDHPALSGEGTISGDLADLKTQQQLAGLATASITAQAHSPLEDLTWEAQIADLKLALGTFDPTLKDRQLSGRLNASGNLQQFAVSSQLKTSLAETGPIDLELELSGSTVAVDVQRLQVRLPKSKGELTLKGKIGQLDADPVFDLKGDWRQLRYPLLGEPQFQSDKGGFSFKGPLDGYRIQMNTALSGRDIPSGSWKLSANGNLQQLQQIDLAGKLLGGDLQAKGDLAWQPALQGQFTLSGDAIDPGKHWPEWPGQIAFKADLKGGLIKEQPQLTVNLSHLRGVLKEQALAGKGQVKLEGQVLQIDDLDLDLPGVQLQARGVVSDRFDLNWQLNAHDISQLLPGSKGRLTGNGQLSGPLETPFVQAQLDGRQLGFQEQRLARVDADLSVDLSGKQSSQLKLEAQDLEAGGQRWNRLRLNASGTPEAHQLDLELDGEPANLDLGLSGIWQAPRWRGTLRRATLQQQQFGRWQLSDASALAFSTDSASLEESCWQHDASNARICLRGGQTGSDTDADLRISALPTSLFAPWLPPGVVLGGALNAQANVNQRQQAFPDLTARVVLDGGQLDLLDEEISLAIDGATLDLNGRNNQIDSQLILQLEQAIGGLQADVTLREVTEQPTIAGNIDLQLHDLQFLSGITPHLQAVRGQVVGKVNLQGQAAAPAIQGQLRLEQASAEVPALGLQLKQIEVVVGDRPASDDLQIEATLTSGEGSLRLDGHFDPQQRVGMLNLKGQRFQAVGTPEVQAWISPDLKFQSTQKEMRLSGELHIPEAHVSPPKTESAVTTSSDVVIIKEEEAKAEQQPEAKIPLDAKVRVSLGDKVVIDALGFEGRLEGSILVEEDSRRTTRATGNIRVASGQYELYGQDFSIDRGNLVYSGGPVDNPGLDMQVTRKVDQVTAGARVGGTAREPQISLFSQPSMPESSILSYLLLGRAPGGPSTTPSEQELLMRAASALTLKGGNKLAESLGSNFSLDEFGFEGGDTATDASVFIGKYLSPKLYVKYGMGLFEPTNTFFMRYKLTQKWSLESETGTTSSGADIIFTHER